MHEALSAIYDYYKDFSTLQLDACAPWFTLPCMFVGLRGTFAVANREDLAKVLGPTLDNLRQNDYQHSEFAEPQMTTLTDNAVLVRGLAVRYRKSGLELERVAIAYLMHRDGDAWKIAVVASSQ